MRMLFENCDGYFKRFFIKIMQSYPKIIYSLQYPKCEE